MNPVRIFGFTAMFLFMVSFVVNGNQNLQLHDRYLVFSNKTIFWLLSSLYVGFALIALLLKWIKRPFEGWVFWVHYLISTLSLGAVAIIYFLEPPSGQMLLSLLFLLFGAGQLYLFFIVLKNFISSSMP